MKRIAEREIMDDEAQARAYAEADFEDAHGRYIDLFNELSCPSEGMAGFVLDLGCGPGDITMKFAHSFKKCVIHGVDASEPMLDYGKKILVREKKLKNRVAFLLGRLPGAMLPIEKYDAVISNTLLHHLASPEILWNSLRLYAKKRAPLFIVDIFRPDTVDEAQKLVDKYAANEPEVLRCDFYNSLLAAYSMDEIKEQLKQTGLEHLTVKIVSDRHIAVFGRL